VSPTLSYQSPSYFHLLLKIIHTRFNAVCPVIKVASIQIYKAFICLRSYLNRQALDLEHCTSPDIIFFNKNNSVFNEKFELLSFLFRFLLFCVLFFESLLFCVLFLVLAHIRIHSEVPTQPPRPWFVVPRTRP
jgi:hypothetical protein